MAASILLVEDNADNRAIYRTILEYGGLQVIEAVSGEDALSAVRDGKPDLILLDISIPVIDGWEVARILKSDPATSEIPIIALTAHAMAEDRQKAKNVGCDGYLAKPIEPRRILDEVRRYLDGRGVES